jgi:cytosine/adenosine deaminase-related metal-dependent hydrolase
VGTILKGATVIEFEPARVEAADLRVENGRIVARGRALEPVGDDEVVVLRDKLVMPGLVSVHHQLFGVLGRGMPRPHPPPQDFEAQQEATTWRLQDALDLDAVGAAATYGALEALCAGTTTVFDHHASPMAVEGSLLRVARGVNEVGLRGVLCYAVSDRRGALGREEGLEENASFLSKARGRFRGMVGAQASATLSRDALEGLREVIRTSGAGLHIGLAEDPSDERLSFQRHGEVPMERLQRLGLLSETTLAVHVVHLSWPELSALISTGAWLVHVPRANMERQVGYAPAGKFGARATLGCADSGGDLFAEADAGALRAQEAGQPISVLRCLANGHRIASQVFGEPIGPLREGALADLLVLDYLPPTELCEDTLAAHLTFGIGARHVESVMIDGVWRMWGRRPLSVGTEAAAEAVRASSQAVWARMGCPQP